MPRTSISLWYASGLPLQSGYPKIYIHAGLYIVRTLISLLCLFLRTEATRLIWRRILVVMPSIEHVVQYRSDRNADIDDGRVI